MPLTLTPPGTAPQAAKRPVSHTHHGITKTDAYAWLRDENWREVMRDPAVLAPDIRAYLEAENAYAEAALAPTKELQERIYGEIRGRLKEDDSSVPEQDGPYAYFSRYQPGAEQPQICRESADGGVEVMLDAEDEAKNESYFRLGAATHSDDHRQLAWSADRNGSEYFTLKVRDLASGTELADTLTDLSSSVVWAADNRSLFYVKLDAEHRPLRVFRHTLGTPQEEDVLVYEEPDPGYYVGVSRSLSGAYVFISTGDHETSEVHLIPADAPETPPLLVEPRRQGTEYTLSHDARRNRFLILTNAGEAEDFQIMEAPEAAPGAANWRPWVAHRPGVLILSQASHAGHHVRLERADGLNRIVVTAFESGEAHEIAFAEEAYDLSLRTGLEYETTKTRFVYSSMTTPAETWDYDMGSRERALRKRQEVPSGHDPSAYVTRRVFATAPDGEQVPVSLLYAKATPLDGTAPCLLYGYGSYGISIPPSFSVSALSLVDRGFVYAIAHIRGGKEKGYGWYTAGKLLKKRNTFTDFIAAADHLAAEGLVRPDGIVGQGGSAGGMLMGAVANMAPYRFAALIAEVPFVDVLDTILDATLPLTPPEWHEWGNPVESEEAYRYIASYSPVDNVTAQAYPAILALAGLTDPRVTYWEPAKWVAALRATSTGIAPILFRTNMGAGHGGASGRFERLREVALAQSFALAVTGKAD